jgi:FlaA1/EpsC-like NDP-sugar epimerase
MLPPRDAPRALILGAGFEALALMQKLRDPLSKRRALLVGILDDDPLNRGRSINQMPVLGPLSRLPAVLRTEAVTHCLLGVSPFSDEGLRIVAHCRQQGIDVYLDLDLLPITARPEPFRAAA